MTDLHEEYEIKFPPINPSLLKGFTITEFEESFKKYGLYIPYTPLQWIDYTATINNLPLSNMNIQENVRLFHDAADQTNLRVPNVNFDPEHKDVKLYVDLIKEESQEIFDGVANRDLVEVADGIADTVWVLMGLANVLGINFAACWQEVLASNMSKTVDGKLIKRADGKVLKPDSYFPPDIKRALGL